MTDTEFTGFTHYTDTAALVEQVRGDEAEVERLIATAASLRDRWDTETDRAIAAEAEVAKIKEAIKFALPVLQAYSVGADEQGHQTAASQLHEAHEVLYRAVFSEQKA